MNSPFLEARLRLDQLLREAIAAAGLPGPARAQAEEARWVAGRLLEARQPDASLRRMGELLESLAETDTLRQEFRGGQGAALERFEAGCRKLAAGDAAALADLKRQIHTWKGEASLAGCAELAAALHELEDLLAEPHAATPETLADMLLGVAGQLGAYFLFKEPQGTSLATLFAEMTGLAENLARTLGKEIECETAGGEMELGGNTVRPVREALLHLVRNAVDHGIEPPEARERLGKPRAGRLLLHAAGEDDAIIITLCDDGRGLEREQILKTAAERGLIRPGAPLTDEEIFALIFRPGFSTAGQVTEFSGRGMGLDTVRTSVECAGGTVEVASQPECGTVFRLRLPR